MEKQKEDLSSSLSTSNNDMAPNSKVVYKSLGQVWRTLTCGPIKESPQVQSIVALCHQIGLVNNENNSGIKFNLPSANGTNSARSSNAWFPFIVIEGLDGTGKTTVTKLLKQKLQMKLMSTPPTKSYNEFAEVRDFFDDQPEAIRRAYYSLGNYIVANDVMKSGQPVVMDRFWHSTAAYALAHQMKSGFSVQESDLIWPDDLLKPDLVIFLRISEHERLRRHANRKAFTNTQEEQTLAQDKKFRENLVRFFCGVKGPRVMQVHVDGKYEDTQKKVIQAVVNSFPETRARLTNEKYLEAFGNP